jgi:hypothetical protein
MLIIFLNIPDFKENGNIALFWQPTTAGVFNERGYIQVG